ncbi:hypothetical protein ACVRZR_02295 [Streptococcus entericus]|uniref:hypothetical protein n=1 Tax=Streptococcus entericus TaxID=155680 RepID=UPI00037C8199|nr:hypothetical protein [Streptococcus entericus]
MTKQKFRKRLLATLLSLLALLAISFGGSYLYYSTGHQAEDPEGLASIQGLNNAEDMVQLGDSQWVLTGNLGDKSWEKGGLYLIDAKTMTWEEAEIDFSAAPAAGYETIKEPELFSAHGIAMKQLDDTSFEIYAVNHGGRESVEVFDLSIAGDKPQIRWKGSVPTPDGMVGNSVAPLSDGFLVTIPMIETDAGTFTDFLAGKATGTVYKWTAEAGYQELPQARLAGNNGIAVSPDEQWAFINGYSDKTVTRISLVDDKAKPVTVPVSFLPDNIRYSSDGSLLVTGQDPHILTVVLLTNGTDIGVSPSDTAVAELDPDTMTVTEVLDLPTFRAFGGGTTALYVGDDLWISSFRAQRIMVVPDAK